MIYYQRFTFLIHHLGIRIHSLESILNHLRSFLSITLLVCLLIFGILLRSDSEHGYPKERVIFFRKFWIPEISHYICSRIKFWITEGFRDWCGVVQIIQSFFFVHIGQIPFVDPVGNLVVRLAEQRAYDIEVNIRITLTDSNSDKYVSVCRPELCQYGPVACLGVVVKDCYWRCYRRRKPAEL